ncbi:uncharacterized protein GGS22DRAFT_95853 [Annulohypoxylon maeteangense]|uniref:uncharacterized protein n=1 Tax=Annulohypoxylon maeteangense TaxID=1927788 RepID=UPI0020077242|nr:uncharacterized protein GGS22DRAFT_95853 [Annulohypoxylon maeteangense]KAI0888305.1 hypothetical protein GGS22DRAFT_95853 [Annulohypoxylon maeteangense]
MAEYLSHYGTYWVYPLKYQSGDIAFPEWCSLLTLCLAPLIAHIAAGFPAPSYLSSRPPKWHESIALYNPTSILWRYAAITDRRIRAKAWDRKDMAGTNALFWTSQGWDGSQEMITLSLPHCTHLPQHNRINLFSSEFIKTAIVTLQGVQALVGLGLALGDGKNSKSGFVAYMGVDLIFFPLAFIGLVRLFCAFWLTDDFAYSTSTPQTGLNGSELQAMTTKDCERRISLDSLLHEELSAPIVAEDRFLPTSYWASRAFRAIFLLPTFLLLAICLMFMIQPGGGKQFTLTAFLVALFYFIFLTTTIFICGYYLVRGHTSTILPCLGTRWYEAYTGILVGMILVIFVISCIETRHTACGKWTSAPYSAGDSGACSDGVRPDVIRMDFNQLPDFGLSTTMPRVNADNKTLGDGDFWVRNFTGTCLGTLGSTLMRHVSTLEEVDLNDLAKVTSINDTLQQYLRHPDD